MDMIKQKLLKLKVLSERGATEGERGNARDLLSKLLKKHDLKLEDLEEAEYLEVKYLDGIVVRFSKGVSFYDHQFPNGSIVRYYRDGGRWLLQKAPQWVQLRVVFSSSTTSTFGGF